MNRRWIVRRDTAASEKKKDFSFRPETMSVLRTIPVRLSGGCSERSLLWNSASGDTVRFFRTVWRKTALACERRMLGFPLLSFVVFSVRL